jgi:hypothetical protein
MKPLAEIVAIKEGLEADLLKRSGVTAVDVGYKYVNGKKTDEIAIRVFVREKKKTVGAAEKIPATFHGVKTDVIQRVYVLHAASNKRKVEDVTLMADTGTYDPVKGGISIGPCRAVGGYIYAGTLGAVVKDIKTGNPLLLSNFHVMCIDNTWNIGDDMCQPSRIDTGSCPNNTIGSIQRAVLSANVDGAVASLQGRGYACQIVDIGDVTGTTSATLGMSVRKRGRTTGLTFGSVDSISLSVNLDYGDGLGVHTLTNQIGLVPDTAHNALFGDHGDSGSVVVDDTGNVVGLYFAGSTDGTGVANPIAAVLSELNITMCTALVKKVEAKEFKLEKIEVKDFKREKIEIKERKPEKYEKAEAKDLKDRKNEKYEFDMRHIKTIIDGPKGIYEGGNPYIPGLPPVEIPTQPGAVQSTEDRLALLEGAIKELALFITPEMRPDMSAGALAHEADMTDADLKALGEQLQKSASDALQAKTDFENNRLRR